MTSKGVQASIEWARAVIVAARPQYGSDLWAVQHYGSNAVVACLDGEENGAAYYARTAAHAAFRALPSLRE